MTYVEIMNYKGNVQTVSTKMSIEQELKNNTWKATKFFPSTEVDSFAKDGKWLSNTWFQDYKTPDQTISFKTTYDPATKHYNMSLDQVHGYQVDSFINSNVLRTIFFTENDDNQLTPARILYDSMSNDLTIHKKTNLMYKDQQLTDSIVTYSITKGDSIIENTYQNGKTASSFTVILKKDANGNAIQTLSKTADGNYHLFLREYTYYQQ